MKKFFILMLCGLCIKFSTAQVMVCAHSQVQITSNLNGANYLWKEVTDTGNVDISQDELSLYSGISTNQLVINSVFPYFTGKRFTCLVNGIYSDTFSIKVVNEWTGAIDSIWYNPANWICGVVPDYATDVIIQNTSTNPVFVSSDAQCRSITLSPNAKFRVQKGVSFQVSSEPPAETLDASDLAILDSIPSVYLSLDSTYLEDGTSVTNFSANHRINQTKTMSQLGTTNIQFSTTKDEVIVDMITEGNYLLNDANFTQYNQPKWFGLSPQEEKITQYLSRLQQATARICKGLKNMA